MEKRAMTGLEQKKITIRGVLVPDQWAENGEITGFALCTDDEQKYVLLYNTDKSALVKMLHQNIKVCGLTTGDRVEKNILVTALSSLSAEEIRERENQHQCSIVNSAAVS